MILCVKDWKIRQRLFHQLMADTDLGDNLAETPIVIESSSELIVQRALEYPSIQRRTLHYPGKSYAVAITFAKLLEIHFGEHMMTALNDPELLYGNDPHYVPYGSNPKTYDEILKAFPWELIQHPEKASPDFQKTMEYFYLEFLLHDRTKQFAPH